MAIQDLLRRFGFQRCSAVQAGLQSVHVQIAGPFGDDQGGHTVADQIGQRAGFAHEAIDAKDQGRAPIGMPPTANSVVASTMKSRQVSAQLYQ
ncbi:hypothetical protein RQP53_20085 [Paucibacter sp. APW11]|uniref:Uncharacterized protein n=1 Tax=Roseateles aquae TaxID=3077235 RepID=A0ABU3PGV3_9BURK|nr:hypothetical protein [Paucibacter sp. APW11]MDT9001587.1 hypothetical protein [Paucibacter sp. APW11]